MDISIYQSNIGSAPAIHWWLSKELNIGPELYDFNTGYCTSKGNHIGAIVIENEEAKYHKLHKESMLLLDYPANSAGVVDVMAPFNDVKKENDYFLWSNYSGNLVNPETIIQADKTIIVDNSPEEQLFFYISQYAFAWIDSEEDIIQQTEAWAVEHNIENWKEVWYNKYHANFLQAFRDGKLNYMWQLNFAHHDLMEQLQKGKDDITLSDIEDHSRLFEIKTPKEDSTADTVFEYTNREIDHLVVDDNWFNHYEEMLSYTGILSSFRLKKYIIDYIKLYKRKKDLYNDRFKKYL